MKESINNLDDKQLSAELHGGYQNAFEEIYRRYYEELRHYAIKRTGDDHVACDLVQKEGAFFCGVGAICCFGGFAPTVWIPAATAQIVMLSYNILPAFFAIWVWLNARRDWQIEFGSVSRARSWDNVVNTSEFAKR